MAGSGRPPEQVIRDWLEEHGDVTVGIEAIERTWDVERLSGSDRRRISQALKEAGVLVEPPLELVSRWDRLELSLSDRGQTSDVRRQAPEPVVEAEPLPEPEPEPEPPPEAELPPEPEPEPELEPEPQPEAEPEPSDAEEVAGPRVVGLGAAALAVGLMVVGSLGPWARDIFVTDYGLDRDGALVIAAAGLAALVLAVHTRRRRASRLPILAAVLGAVAIGILASDFREVVDDTFVEPAWGIYAAAAGSVLLVVLSMSLLVRRS